MKLLYLKLKYFYRPVKSWLCVYLAVLIIATLILVPPKQQHSMLRDKTIIDSPAGHTTLSNWHVNIVYNSNRKFNTTDAFGNNMAPDIRFYKPRTDVESLIAAPKLASPSEFYDRTHRVNARCRKMIRMGGSSCYGNLDAEKYVCLEPHLVPPIRDCVLYSFGVDFDVTFEDTFWNYRKCEEHLYDPNIERLEWNNGKDVKFHGQHFHNAELTEANQDQPYYQKMGSEVIPVGLRSFESLLQENGHTDSTISYLKMDIEGTEWRVLPQIIKKGLLRNVLQIAIEIHLTDILMMPQELWLDTLQERYDILRSIEREGFAMVNVLDNEHMSCEIEFNDTARYIKHANEQQTTHDKQKTPNKQTRLLPTKLSRSSKVETVHHENDEDFARVRGAIMRATSNITRKEHTNSGGARKGSSPKRNDDSIDPKENYWSPNWRLPVDEWKRRKDEGLIRYLCQEILYVRINDT